MKTLVFDGIMFEISQGHINLYMDFDTDISQANTAFRLGLGAEMLDWLLEVVEQPTTKYFISPVTMFETPVSPGKNIRIAITASHFIDGDMFISWRVTYIGFKLPGSKFDLEDVRVATLSKDDVAELRKALKGYFYAKPDDPAS